MLGGKAWFIKSVSYRCTVYLPSLHALDHTVSMKTNVCSSVNIQTRTFTCPISVYTEIWWICSSVVALTGGEERQRQKVQIENVSTQSGVYAACVFVSIKPQVFPQREIRWTVKHGWQEHVWTRNHASEINSCSLFNSLMSSHATLFLLLSM